MGLLAAPMAWLVVAYLGALGVHLRDGVLHHRPVHRTRSSRRSPWRTSPSSSTPTYLRHHRAHAAHRRARHGALHPHRGAVRVLHGAGGTAAAAEPARGGGAGAAVGVVPRQGLRLAGDAPARGSDGRRSFGSTPGYGLVAVVLTLTYLWLPYMILPVYAGLRAAAGGASRGVGGPRRLGGVRRSGGSCCRRSCPSIVAGLDLHLLAEPRRLHRRADRRRQAARCSAPRCVQNIVLDLPFAAALGTASVVIMVIYLTLAGRTGALDNL